MIKDLKELLIERDDYFRMKTVQLFEMAIPALQCITDFLNEIDETFAAGNVSWEEISYDDDLVCFVGNINYENDTMMQDDDGNVITVTDDNADYFARIINMSLPVELIAHGSYGDITKFLYDLHTVDDDSTEIDVPTIDDVPPSYATTGEDFDWAQLSPTQKRSLITHGNKAKN